MTKNQVVSLPPPAHLPQGESAAGDFASQIGAVVTKDALSWLDAVQSAN
jgi:hypothetical protein